MRGAFNFRRWASGDVRPAPLWRRALVFAGGLGIGFGAAALLLSVCNGLHVPKFIELALGGVMVAELIAYRLRRKKAVPGR